MRNLRAGSIGSIRAWLPSRRSTLHQVGGAVIARLGHVRSAMSMGVNGRYLDAGVGNMSAFSDRRRELVPPAASHFWGLPVRKCWCESGLVGADRWRVGFIAPGGAEAKARAAAPAGRRSQSGMWMSRNGAWVEPSIVAALGASDRDR